MNSGRISQVQFESNVVTVDDKHCSFSASSGSDMYDKKHSYSAGDCPAENTDNTSTPQPRSSVASFVRRRMSVNSNESSNEEKEEKQKNVPKLMFADANAMKANLHENIDKKDYDVTDLYYDTGFWQALAKNDKFQNLTLFVIAFNACWIGVDADHNKAASLNDADLQFQVAENFFCVAFTFELMVRFFSFRHKFDCMRDNWFRFDAALVLLMIAETWVIPHIIGGGSGGSMSNISILRLLRLLRLTRLVRIMRSVPELITMLKGVAAATRSVAATLALLMIALYVFSIIFKQQLEGKEVLFEMFGTIPRSMWTLILSGTFQDNLTGVLEHLRDNAEDLAPPMVFLFLIFVLISSLTILNMLIGVLCEVVSAVAAVEKEKAVVSYVKTALIDVLVELDEDGTGTISKDEFSEILAVPSAVEALQALGVDVPSLYQLADVIFDMEGDAAEDKDTWGEKLTQRKTVAQMKYGESRDNELTFGEFLELVLRLRAENSASVPDIVDLRKFIRFNQTKLSDKLGIIKETNEITHAELYEDIHNTEDQLGELNAATVGIAKKLELLIQRQGLSSLPNEVAAERRPIQTPPRSPLNSTTPSLTSINSPQMSPSD